MENSDVNKILKVFHSNDWSRYYDYQNISNFKKNIWFKINKVKEFNFVRDLITKDIQKINPNYTVSEWITFLIYNEGDFFGNHIDGPSYSSSKSNTILTGGYLLNTDFEGGDFIIENKKLSTGIGELFVFGRNDWHEVKEVTYGTRYSLHFAINEKIPSDKKIL